MTLIYIGFSVSAILFFLGLALLIYGGYVSYKHIGSSPPSTSPVKLITVYDYWAALCFGLATFLLFTGAIGFTWENLGFSIILASVTLGFAYLDHFIRYKTYSFLRRQ
jgi:hypothetical protein